jgi:hypothetical protein
MKHPPETMVGPMAGPLQILHVRSVEVPAAIIFFCGQKSRLLWQHAITCYNRIYSLTYLPEFSNMLICSMLGNDFQNPNHV